MMIHKSCLRILCILLAILSVLSFASCAVSEPSEGEESTTAPGEESASASVKEEESESETEPPVQNHVINEDSETYYFARGSETSSAVFEMMESFGTILKNGVGLSYRLVTDLTSKKSAYEFLFGETIREESQVLMQKLKEAGGNRFGILVSEKKIAIAAEDPRVLHKGMEYFLKNCFTVDENRKVSISLPVGYEYISDEVEASYTLDELRASRYDFAYYAVEKMVHVPSKGEYEVMQGGGTDGKYAYVGMKHKSLSPEEAYIYKYDMETWELIKVSESLPTGHTNDITYDAKNHRLVVSYCSTLDGYLGIVFINPDTLEFIEYKKTTISNRAVEYLPATNQYLFGSNWTCTLTDENFNVITSFPFGDKRFVSQGMCSDGKYVYDARYVTTDDTEYGPDGQCIVVQAIDSTYIGTYGFYGVTTEPEHIYLYKDGFIIGCNGEDSLFYAVLIPTSFVLS